MWLSPWMWHEHSTCNSVGRKTKKMTAAAELKLLTTGILETCSSLETANLSSCTKIPQTTAAGFNQLHSWWPIKFASYAHQNKTTYSTSNKHKCWFINQFTWKEKNWQKRKSTHLISLFLTPTQRCGGLVSPSDCEKTRLWKFPLHKFLSVLRRCRLQLWNLKTELLCSRNAYRAAVEMY